jgi:hypothetical protein
MPVPDVKTPGGSSQPTGRKDQTMPTIAEEEPHCEPQIAAEARNLLEYIARCSYVLDRHREAIVINSQRIAEAQARLDELERDERVESEDRVA